MKNKLVKIWGIGLALTLLVSLLISAIPVSAGTLSYGNEGLLSATNNGLVTTPGLDIVDIAIAADGVTMYAVTGNFDNKIYKSTDGGTTWTDSLLPMPAQ